MVRHLKGGVPVGVGGKLKMLDSTYLVLDRVFMQKA
jgi:hypothetical protein